MAKVTFQVEFELPPHATVPQAIDYIQAALDTECGMRPPEDPMHHFEQGRAQVRYVQPASKGYSK